MALSSVESLSTPPEIETQRLKPSQITEEQFHKLGLVELVGKGYGYGEIVINNIAEAGQEYAGEDNRSVIFLATDEGRAVGSLAVTLWSQEDEPTGKTFWETLEEINPSLYRRANKRSPLAVNITGVVTHPDYRRKGVADKLYKRLLLETSQPSFILGLTKFPEAVLARANILGRAGYRTFFGDSEVTPQKEDESSRVHFSILQADVRARGQTFDEDCIYFCDDLKAVIPNVSDFPPLIQSAFEKLVQKQESLGYAKGCKTAVKTLVSVRKDLTLKDISPQLPLFESL